MRNKSKAIAISNQAQVKRARVLLGFGFLLTIIAFFLSFQANAQQSAFKPKLIPIVLNEETNDPKALEIAKKLDPEFFEIDEDYMRGSPAPKFFALFAPLDKNNPKGFIVLTTTDNAMFCGSRGCPTRLFINTKNNKWTPVLDLIVDKIWFDENTQGNSKNNIITQNLSYNDKATAVWMWSGGKYMKVNK